LYNSNVTEAWYILCTLVYNGLYNSNQVILVVYSRTEAVYWAVIVLPVVPGVLTGSNPFRGDHNLSRETREWFSRPGNAGEGK
jgi:hypothetical protein